MRNRGLIGLLTLALMLVAMSTWAQDGTTDNFTLVNNSGETLKVHCSVGNTSIEPFNDGDTENFTCTGTVTVQVYEGGPDYSFTFLCATGQVYTVTINSSSGKGALNFHPQCNSPSTEQSSTGASS